MAPSSPCYKREDLNSAASVSRSRSSRDDIQLLADEMLRTSLSRSVSSASKSTPTALPPSYRPALSTLSPHSTVRTGSLHAGRGKNPVGNSPLTMGSTSISTTTSLALSRENDNSIVRTPLSRVSAAEAKSRVRQLQLEVERVNAESPPRATAGLFKTACSTDLLFLIDTTYSMDPYIAAAKQQVRRIVDDIKAAFLDESDVRVAVVGYADHADKPNVQFLDFTPSTDHVHQFLDKLHAKGGDDIPEDVLGGIRQALNASWRQQTRCVIHIADAPPHGRVLHDLDDTHDDYPEPGSEPHGLEYEPLLRQLVELKINYALLRINSTTDRMALAFSEVYAAAGADVKLLPSNAYYSHINGLYADSGSSLEIGESIKRTISAEVQFEELQLGTTYSELRHLVIRSVTGSVTRTANRLAMTLFDGGNADSSTGGKAKNLASNLTAINEDEGSGGHAGNVALETGPPRWDKPGWLDETLVVEGFCPDVVLHGASTLNDMMEADENIKLSFAELTVYARSRPFAQGSLRLASYARTAASTSRFVVKSFKDDGKGRAHLAEDMRIQALCKAFALEFNGLLETEDPIDFIVTTCLQSKPATASGNGCLSLEPFLEGEYVKYNSNGLFVKEDSPDDPFNRTAQAFSHFTFERSWGHFLVTDLQGVGNLLTDPAVQTKDHERFKLNPTNLNQEGFKFFFVGHECNAICRKLGLKSNREMVVSGNYEFRERWPTMDPTVCCSNKLCRRIIRLASAHKSAKFPGYHWCDACWPQLQSSVVQWICVAPGPNHEFDVSRFFHESQAQTIPRRCPEHLEKDTTVSSAAVVGGNMWSRMKAAKKKSSISGSSW